MSHTLLRQYRVEREISTADMAARLGVAESTLRSLENGTRPITPENAKEFEERLHGELTRYQLRPDFFGDPPPAPSKRSAAAR